MKTKGYLLSWKVWAFSALCILLNLGLSYLCHVCEIPLFLNTIGTILAGALCGEIPALVVALVTNVAFLSIDAMDAYYASLTILMGFLAVFYSRLGILKKWWGLLIAFASFVIIDGIFVTMLVYFINGNSFGDSIAAPYAIWWQNQGFSPFSALLIADFLIGIADKAIVVPLVGIFLYFLPKYLIEGLPLGNIYSREKHYQPNPIRKATFHSLKFKLVIVNILTDFIIGLAFSTLFFYIYRNATIDDYEGDGVEYSLSVGKMVDGSQIDSYLASPSNPGGSYDETLAKIEDTYTSSNGKISSIYVYKVTPTSLQVVFAADGSSDTVVGRSLPFSGDLATYKDELISGASIAPFLTSDGDTYTVFTPILDSGNTVAYAVVDIDMQKAVTEINVALAEAIDITVIILFFGASVVDYVSENWITGPLHILDQQIASFDDIGPDRWLDSPDWIHHQEIRTGDELEDLDKHLCESEETIASSYAAIEIQNREIQKLQQSVVSAFAEMVESRDPLTGDHVKRASFYVGAIVRELVRENKETEILTPDYIEALVIAAPLHDIGKIVIPDAILNKPGKLTPAEFEIMKTHTSEGKRIIEKAMEGASNRTYLSIAAEIAYTHHERWDGTGYPQGISGDKIPLGGRIMAVADVFDALVSKRPYKEAFSFDEAISIIKKETGTHFDPMVASAFIAIQEKIRAYLKGKD